MNKQLEYYMGLPYLIEVLEIPQSEGGGFQARLPELGRLSIIGDGETIQEAIENMIENKRERFAAYLEKGLDIPEPVKEETLSGKFVLRIPPRLHMVLNDTAKRRKISLNQHVRKILEEHVTSTDIMAAIKSLQDELKRDSLSMRHQILMLNHRVNNLDEQYFELPQSQRTGLCTISIQDAHTQPQSWREHSLEKWINAPLASSGMEALLWSFTYPKKEK